jgi:hypothetical protein
MVWVAEIAIYTIICGRGIVGVVGATDVLTPVA